MAAHVVPLLDGITTGDFVFLDVASNAVLEARLCGTHSVLLSICGDKE